MTLVEVTWTVAETLTSSKGLVFLAVLMFVGGVSADYYYTGGSDDFEFQDFEEHEEILYEFVAPFLLIFVLLKFSLQKALEFTFATDDENVPWEDGPDLGKEATVMALAITLMLVASPYWSWVQTTASGIGLLTLLGLVLALILFAWVFMRP